MMVQASAPYNSVDYLICKKAIALKTRIKSYSMKRFISEIGISKSSMVNFLQALEVKKFSHFKEVMYSEWMLAYLDMTKQQQTIMGDEFPQEVQAFVNLLKSKQRVLILGDGNRFALAIYQKALLCLGIELEIPIYLGSEERVVADFELDGIDLVILVSLHETYASFLENRTLFYQGSEYLTMAIKPEVCFMGVLGQNNAQTILDIPISEGMASKRIGDLVAFFEATCLALLQQAPLDELF